MCDALVEGGTVGATVGGGGEEEEPSIALLPGPACLGKGRILNLIFRFKFFRIAFHMLFFVLIMSICPFKFLRDMRSTHVKIG